MNIEAAGHRVAVRRWGSGPPDVVLVHGIGVSHRYFVPLARVLAAEHGLSVLVPDLPGFGASPRPPRPLSMAEHARVLGAVLDHVGVGATRRPVMLGHSMGAQVVTELAAQRPGAAQRVVLLGPVADPAARTATRQALRLLRDMRRESPRTIALMLADWLRCGPRWYLATLPCMIDHLLEERLGDVTDPVVLLRGEFDPVTPPGYLHLLAASATDAVVGEVPGEGHNAMVRDPGPVARWLVGPLPERDGTVRAESTVAEPSREERAGGTGVVGALRRGSWWLRDYVHVVGWQVQAVRHRREPEAFVEGRPGCAPVLLVPGVYEPWSFLRPLAVALHGAGHPVHVLPALGYNRRPVTEGAALIGTHLAAHDLRDVLIVAHSKGGLTGKLAMLREDPDGRIAGMVAVNTPFGGSSYARFLPVPAVRAFVPTDATLVALAAEVEVNSRITSVFSVFDPHIPGGSVLEGAANVEVATPGHFRALADPEILAVTLAAAGACRTS